MKKNISKFLRDTDSHKFSKSSLAKLPITLTLLFLTLTSQYVFSQTIVKSNDGELKITGYIRSGFAKDKEGNTQVSLQMPDAPSKFSLGNQPDTYGELEFRYKHFLNDEKDKSIEVRWMTSYYESFNDESSSNLNEWEKLNIRFHNLLNRNEIIWIGKRFYDRHTLYMIDRHWLNQGQTGIGFGMEQLLSGSEKGGQDIKWGVWRLERDDVKSFKNEKEDELINYLADIRWVKIPIAQNYFVNFALNYSVRTENEDLGYDTKHGYGAISWLDYTKNNISHTTALLYKKGANIFKDHATGESIIENPNNDKIVIYDLDDAYTLELNHSFLYDDKENFAFNATLVAIHKDFGTAPKVYNQQLQNFQKTDAGHTMDWIGIGARPMVYINKYFRLTGELSYEYINNKSAGVQGNMTKLAFTPEFSLKKGFYSMPVVRPYIAYAHWSNELKGSIASSSEYLASRTSGLMFGLQFELWW
ncbi:maltoporin [Balneicella halophila]|uniref:Maltoporin n=1 Tax=Balneicella halophila TaxID=1537566 RepID=A0A7L4UPH1_BALHA|nr:carbohydrate porin [Balneicella halophila]PVX51025.1 maltoporin [Balneicella halophila]